MIDVRKPVSNPELAAAMDKMRTDSSKENQDEFIIELKKAHFLVPVSLSDRPDYSGTRSATLSSGAGVSFEMLESADGKVCIPVFTDWEQLDKWKEVPDHQTMIININDLNYMVTSNSKVSGFVINPFGHCVMFTEDMIRILLKLEGKDPGNIYGGQASGANREDDRMASAAKDIDGIFKDSQRRRETLNRDLDELAEDAAHSRRNTYQSLEEKYRQERLKGRQERPDGDRAAGMEAGELGLALDAPRKKEKAARGIQATAYEVYDDTDVKIGDPKFYPHELVDCVSFYLKKQRSVKAVYLKLMEREGEKSFLFIVDFSGDRQSVFSGIAEAAAPYLKGMYLDMVPYDSEFGQKAAEESKPFYTKKKFGLF